MTIGVDITGDKKNNGPIRLLRTPQSSRLSGEMLRKHEELMQSRMASMKLKADLDDALVALKTANKAIEDLESQLGTANLEINRLRAALQAERENVSKHKKWQKSKKDNSEPPAETGSSDEA